MAGNNVLIYRGTKRRKKVGAIMRNVEKAFRLLSRLMQKDKTKRKDIHFQIMLTAKEKEAILREILKRLSMENKMSLHTK